MTDSPPYADVPPALAASRPMNDRLAAHAGRRFLSVEGARWGELILPAPDEAPTSSGGLRVVLFASFEYGYLALEAVKAYAARFPGRVTLAGLATDDAANASARIGLKKRIWKYVDTEERVAMETAMAEAALRAGAPAFTGEIKTDGFRRILREEWRPDVIISCVFGQVIGPKIIAMPTCGIYNFHPSDLLHGHGAGPAPDEDLDARGAHTTVWSIHQVSPEIDTGPVVAVSPPITVRDGQGQLPENRLVLYDKLLEPVGALAAGLTDALWRRFAAGARGPLDALDIAPALPPDLALRMLEPVRAGAHDENLPAFDAALLERYA